MLTKYFGDKAFWKTTLSLALPIAFQNLLISSFSLVDTVMVGQLGDITLASVGMATQWSWLMNMMLFGFCSGTAVFVSQYWGINDRKGIQRVYGTSLVFIISLSLLFMVAGTFAPRFIVGIFNSTPEVIESGASYLRIVAFSYPAIALNSIFATILRTTENVKLPMYASCISTVINFIANYVLIFGAFGFPEMGVRGAAIATCISSWIAPIFLYYISFRQRNILIGRLRDIFSFTKKSVIAYLKKASPVALNETLWGIGTILFNIIFGRLGYENYAAVTILRTFSDISFVFFIGLCNACCVIVGKSIGSGDLKKGYLNAQRFSVLVPVFSAIIGIIIVIFRHQFVMLFNLSNNLTAQTISSAAGIMLVVGSELSLRNIPYIQIVGIFRSGGDTFTGIKYDMICLWLISLPLTYIAAFVLKLPFIVVYAVMLFSEDILKAILSFRYFFSKKWIKPVTEEGKRALNDAAIQ